MPIVTIESRGQNKGGKAMQIGELAEATGCKVVTIRYYEKKGLLPAFRRTEGNYRVYATEDLDRLKFILHCRRHGMGLDDVKKLLLFRDQPQRDCTWVKELIHLHIQNVEEQIRSLEHLKKHLAELYGKCNGESNGAGCGIIQSLDCPESNCPTCSFADRGKEARENSVMLGKAYDKLIK